MFKMSKKYHNKTSLEITTNCKLPTPLTLPPLQGNHQGSFKQKAFNRGELLLRTMKEWKSETEMDRQKRKAVTTRRGDEITGGNR